ncbi:MAG: hypothetical protein ACOYBE_07115 [Blautia sp.]|jgi:hypothetical protein
MYQGLGLLEYLAQELNCMFLSDLHSQKFLEAIRREVCLMDWSRFSLKEWKDAVTYITGTNPDLETVEQAAEYLLHILPGNKKS